MQHQTKHEKITNNAHVFGFNISGLFTYRIVVFEDFDCSRPDPSLQKFWDESTDFLTTSIAKKYKNCGTYRIHTFVMAPAAPEGFQLVFPI